MKKLIFLLSVFFISTNLFAQLYSQKDIVNLFDPFTIAINDLVLNTNDEDYKEHNYVIMMTISIGPEKLIKFIYKEDMIINSVKNFDDVYWQLSISVRKNNVILIPSLYTLPNSAGAISFKFEGYSNLNEADAGLLTQMSSSSVYTSSALFTSMDWAYRFLSTSTDFNRPNMNLLTTAEVLQRNLSSRPGVFIFGAAADITYLVPPDPNKVFGTNILIQGKKTLDSPPTVKAKDKWEMNITKLSDVRIVQSEGYFTKIKGVFSDIISQTLISPLKSEGFIAKAHQVITEDLVIGKKSGVYMNDQVIKQFTQLMNLLKAGVRAKSDSAGVTSDFMKSDEREALTYFQANMRDNDYNLDNQYLYDDYINSGVNRGLIQKEMDVISRYYQIK